MVYPNLSKKHTQNNVIFMCLTFVTIAMMPCKYNELFVYLGYAEYVRICHVILWGIFGQVNVIITINVRNTLILQLVQVSGDLWGVYNVKWSACPGLLRAGHICEISRFIYPIFMQLGGVPIHIVWGHHGQSNSEVHIITR